MSESALAGRIKAIERAKGKHAVIKMRLFARVLFLEARAASLWLRLLLCIAQARSRSVAGV